MKKRLFVFCVVSVSLIISGSVFCIRQRQWRTELAPLTNLFPVFSEAEDCCWKVGNHSSFFTIPGPSCGWIKGYIKLPTTTLEQLYQNYAWVQTEGTPYQIESGPDYPYEDAPWFFSQKFSVDVLMPKFVGQIYLCKQYNVLFIYAEFA